MGRCCLTEPFRLYLFVPCFPAGQPRAKATIRGRHAGVYTPTTIGKGIDKRPHPAVEFRHAVRSAVLEQIPKDFTLLEGPIAVSQMFWFPRPASMTKKKLPNPAVWKSSKPDRDNLDKGCLDCLTGVLWVDDAQVCDGRIRKAIVEPGQQPGVEILIETLSGVPTHLLSDRKENR